MSLESVADLVGLAVASGALDVGGPLTPAETSLALQARKSSKSDAREVRNAIRNGSDPLGNMFCSLRSPVQRRSIGAFYTSPSILEPMLEWVLKQTPTRIVDAGCGSGRFSVAAARRLKNVNLVAVDIDPLATLLTRAALASVNARNVRVIQGDYLSVSLPPHDGRTAFIGNPPYVRHHDLSASTKARAAILAKRVGYSISGLSGLHALFYVATLAQHGRPGDVGTFVTSAEWLDVRYGSIIRQMFTNGLGGRSLTVYDPKSIPFEDAMATAAITTFQLGEERSKARFAHVASTDGDLALEIVGREVDRTVLASSERWSPFLHERAVAEAAEETVGSRFRVSRGQVTGANAFFTMTRHEARVRGIEDFCVPIVSRAEEIIRAAGILHDSPDRILGLEIPRTTDISRFPQLSEYLQAGELAGINKGYVASRRSPWWAVTFPKPPIVATYMSRQAPVFALNPDNLGLLNIAHGLYPRAPIDSVILTSVVESLNANRSSFIGQGRTYHGGLEKFEPREMEALSLEVPCL